MKIVNKFYFQTMQASGESDDEGIEQIGLQNLTELAHGIQPRPAAAAPLRPAPNVRMMARLFCSLIVNICSKCHTLDLHWMRMTSMAI